MSTVFEKIISGEWAGRFIWADSTCVVFSTIEPVRPGHVLVVPRQPWDKWTDCPEEVAAHLMKVARIIGTAQEEAFNSSRSVLLIAGFDVPHTHLHVLPADGVSDMDLTRGQAVPEQELDEAALRLRDQLVANGYEAQVPPQLHSLQ